MQSFPGSSHDTIHWSIGITKFKVLPFYHWVQLLGQNSQVATLVLAGLQAPSQMWEWPSLLEETTQRECKVIINTL